MHKHGSHLCFGMLFCFRLFLMSHGSFALGCDCNFWKMVDDFQRLYIKF